MSLIMAANFKFVYDQLAAIGRPIDETNKSHWFLRGLGPIFSSFSAAQMALVPITYLHYLISRAESFEIFQQSLEGTAVLAPAAFAANEQHHQTFRSSNRGGRDNRNNYGRGRGRGCFDSSKCQICKRDGHIANHCRYRYARKDRDDSANLAYAFNESCSLASLESSDWYHNAGALAHMMNGATALDLVTPYSEPNDRKRNSNKAKR